MADDEIIAELMQEGVDDWVQLHSVVWFATLGELTSETKATTLRILDRLYREDLMVPGDLGDAGFEDWPPPPSSWLERSKAELEHLNWWPMGAGFWLRLTELGQTRAAEEEPSET